MRPSQSFFGGMKKSPQKTAIAVRSALLAVMAVKFRPRLDQEYRVIDHENA